MGALEDEGGLLDVRRGHVAAEQRHHLVDVILVLVSRVHHLTQAQQLEQLVEVDVDGILALPSIVIVM